MTNHEPGYSFDPAEQPVPVRIVSGSKSSESQVYVKKWSPRERTFRTVRTVGIFWGIGVVALFIPVAHFVLVPLFLLLGLLSPFFTPAKEGVVLGGTAKCPACDSELAIPRMPERWPLSDVCSSCKRALTIQKA